MTADSRHWDELATDYTRATGIPCRVLRLTDDNPVNCSICQNFEKRYKHNTLCSGLHLFSAYQSERWGGRYIYICPLSGLHWSSPLMLDGMMAGALVAGPSILHGLDDFTLGRIGNQYDLPDEDRNSLGYLFMDCKILSPERARSLSEVLYAQAMAGSERKSTLIFDDQDSFRHESRIGEYIHLLKSMEGDKNSDLEYPINLENKLMVCVTKGNKKEAQVILDELLATVMYQTGVNLDVIKSRVLELVVLISRAAMEGGADVEQIFGLNYHYLKNVRSCKTIEQLSSWLRRIIERFGSLVFDLHEVKHTDTILRALRFIRENFYERLTLADVAGQVSLSPDYFGKLFRSELKTSFTDYLNQLRIEEAKRLLKTRTSALGDVAYACGFEDQSYFTKVFRKVVGITPSQFRESDPSFFDSRNS